MNTKQVQQLSIEGVVIIASILVAFAIDTWWESNNDLEEEYRILNALESETQSKLQTIQNKVIYRDVVMSSSQKLLDYARNSKKFDDPEELDSLIGDLLWFETGDFSIGALRSLVQSGNLTLLNNDDLRTRIAALPNSIENIALIEFQEYENYRNVAMPYLSKNSTLAQIWQTLRYKPGTDADFGTLIPVLDRITDHHYLLDDLEFQGLVILEISDQADARYTNETTGNELEEIRMLIQQELKRFD